MKWLYVIQQKAQVAFLLALILLGVFVKNVMERNNVSVLGTSFSSVYEDRLVVESYIYKLSDHLYQKHILIDQCSHQEDVNLLRSKIAEHNAAITALIQDYEKTKLTTQELHYFSEFKKNINELISMESQLFHNDKGLAVTIPAFDQQLVTATANLDQLSRIQIMEGKSMAEQSKRIVAGSSILTQFELAMIIIIGLIIQALIFASNSLTPTTFQNHRLN